MEEVINNAERVRVKIQSLPNYTLTSAKELAEELKLVLHDEDIPLFMKTLLQTPHPYSRDYARLHFTWTINDYLAAYAAQVRVTRDNMVNRLVITQRIGYDRMTEYVEVKRSEVVVRHYDENQHFTGGIIYPLPEEDALRIMIIADQWLQELPPRETIPIVNGVLKCPVSPSPVASSWKWEIAFYSYAGTHLDQAFSSAPYSPHADEIKEIIGKVLPEVEPYIF